ncbi:MAG: recombinase family protein [Actinomycetota bacterium]|nr:recombinase family protein [Actinomycetota bacterium]
MPSTNGHGPKQAILYARVSTDEQARSGHSLAQQLEALREYAAGEGYEVLEEVSDPGWSGAYLDRPGLDHVRDLVQSGGVRVVLAQDRDRFAREPAYHYLLKREFGEHGCRLKALNDRGDDSPEGELTDGILDQLARYERAKTAERSRRGKLRRAREGKVIAGTRCPYGFNYNDTRDNYVVDPERMAVVRRIFEMLATEGTTVYAVQHELKRMGIPSPSGNVLWSYPTLRMIVLDDVYRSHTYEVIAQLVSPEVAGRLEQEASYGIWWFNRRRGEMRKVVEVGPDGERVYRKRYKEMQKPRSEWVAVPIPDAGIPREWVDRACEVIKDNKRASNAGRRFWPLSGGILRCPTCDWSMSPHTIAPGAKSRKRYYYYRCSNHMKSAYDGCSNYRHYRAQELEEQVWQEVRALLRDPGRLRAGMDTVIEMHRAALRGNPEREAKTWLDKLTEIDRKRARYQEMAAEEFITLDELREKLADLQETRIVAEQALEELQGRAGRISELERDRDTLLASYEALALEELDDLTPEEHHGFYRTLRMIVYVHPEGGVELRGEFLPFGPPGPDDPPGDGSGGSPGSNGSGPSGNGGPDSAKSVVDRRGFSTNINTQACGVAARARRDSVRYRRPATLAARTLSRPPGGCRGPRPAARPASAGGTSGTCPRSTVLDP